MTLTRAGLAAAGLLACLVIAAAAGAGAIPSPAAPAAERTDPGVTPRHGGRHTTFTVSFTAREAAGQHDGATWRYEVMAVRRVSGRPASCTAAVTRDAMNVVVGQRIHVRLRPTRRWCAGAYRATVLLDRQVACVQPTGQPPVACPAIAFAPQDTGHVSFIVR
jgi:hypothetical protein